MRLVVKPVHRDEFGHVTATPTTAISGDNLLTVVMYRYDTSTNCL